MQTIQYRRTRIWEMKKDKYTNTVAKNQVYEIFQMRNIRKNGLRKFIKLRMETPCWCPFQEHQYGRRIPTETSVLRKCCWILTLATLEVAGSTNQPILFLGVSEILSSLKYLSRKLIWWLNTSYSQGKAGGGLDTTLTRSTRKQYNTK